MEDHQSPVADKPAPRRPWKRASSLAPSRRCGRATFGRSEPSCRLRAGGAISRRSISRSTVSCGAATWSGGRAIAPPQLGVDTSRGRVRSEVSTLKCRRPVVVSQGRQVFLDQALCTEFRCTRIFFSPGLSKKFRERSEGCRSDLTTGETGRVDPAVAG